MEKSCKKYATKASPKPLFYFGITKNNNYMQETLLKLRYYGRGHQKVLKANFIFSCEPTPF